MKVKLSEETIKQILDDPERAADAKVKASDPWWLILIKIVGYICGLIAAGAATSCTASATGII